MKKRSILILLFTFFSALLFSFIGCGGSNDDSSYINWNLYYPDNLGPFVMNCGVTYEEQYLDYPLDFDEEITGYNFVGIFSEPNGEGEKYFNEQRIKVTSEVIKEGDSLYAYFVPVRFTVLLMDGDNVFSTYANEPYDHLFDKLPIPTDIPIEKVFCGWKGKDFVTDGKGNMIKGKEKLNTKSGFILDWKKFTVTLTAEYKTKQFTVKYDLAGVTGNLSEAVDYGAVIEEFPKIPEIWENKKLLGFASDKSAFSFTLYNGEPIIEDITLYAIYSPYTEVSVYSGAEKLTSFDVFELGERIYLEDAEIDIPKGYKINGWYINENLTSIIHSVSYQSGIDILYVDISAIQYNVNISAGSDVSVSGNTSFTYTVNDKLELPRAEKEYYEFLGWCTDRELKTTPVKSIPAGTTGDMTLYPKFKGINVVITLDGQNGEQSYTVKREYGSEYTLPVPEKSHYTFFGWRATFGGGATDEKGKGTSALDYTEPVTFYAMWTLNSYTVSFIDGKGEVYETKDYYHGSHLVLPKYDSDELKFEGWYTDKEYKTVATDGMSVTGEMTVYARIVESTAISTADELRAIASDPSKNYHLTRDINLGGDTWTPIEVFGGILNGDGHKIFNFGLSSAYSKNFGFIKVNNGTVRNISFTDFTMGLTAPLRGNISAGVVIGENNGSVINCSVYNETTLLFNVSENSGSSETISSALNVGVIAGLNNGLIAACNSDISIDVKASVLSNVGAYSNYDSSCTVSVNMGGIVGVNINNVENCITKAVLKSYFNCISKAAYFPESSAVGYCYVGGIAGLNGDYKGVIYRCSSQCDISNTFDVSNNDGNYGHYNNKCHPAVGTLFGGICGGNTSKISECYASGTITARTSGPPSGASAGGLIGSHWGGEASNCYCSTNVSSENNCSVGGLIGYCNVGKLQNCYAYGAVTAGSGNETIVGGLVGYIYDASFNINGCCSACNVTVGTVKNSGIFVGLNNGTLRKCYYADTATLTVNGTPVTDADNGATVKAIDMLYKTEFLIDELYWDEFVWVIDGTDRPELEWLSAHN